MILQNQSIPEHHQVGVTLPGTVQADNFASYRLIPWPGIAADIIMQCVWVWDLVPPFFVSYFVSPFFSLDLFVRVLFMFWFGPVFPPIHRQQHQRDRGDGLSRRPRNQPNHSHGLARVYAVLPPLHCTGDLRFLVHVYRLCRVACFGFGFGFGLCALCAIPPTPNDLRMSRQRANCVQI